MRTSPKLPTPAQLAVNDIAYVDLIDVCNLKCPTCVRGVRVMENSAKKMPLDKFLDIVGKLKGEGFKQVGLFNWTEPFLNRNLHDYVTIVKNHGLRCMVSTNFSLRRIDDLEAALRAGIDHLIISVSGIDQAVYEINHVDGRIEYIKSNIERTAALKRSGAIRTKVVLRFLRFEHNRDQQRRLEAYAQDLGIEFEAVPGQGDPFHIRKSHMTDQYYKGVIAEYRSERPFDPPGKVCPLMLGQAVIDCLCCVFPTHESMKVGKYLDSPHEELLLRKFNHPICTTCSFPRREASLADREVLLEAMRRPR